MHRLFFISIVIAFYGFIVKMVWASSIYDSKYSCSKNLGCPLTVFAL